MIISSIAHCLTLILSLAVLTAANTNNDSRHASPANQVDVNDPPSIPKNPTRTPTTTPSRSPTRYPTRGPTPYPTRKPTPNPTREPTKYPTREPSLSPTISCSVSGGSFLTTSGTENVVVTYSYEMISQNGFTPNTLIPQFEDQMGTLVVQSMFPMCVSSRRSMRRHLSSDNELEMIAGMSMATPQDIELERSCSSDADTIGAGNTCTVFYGGLTIYLKDEHRSLLEDEENSFGGSETSFINNDIQAIAMNIIEESMDSGTLMDQIDGIEGLVFIGDLPDDDGVDVIPIIETNEGGSEGSVGTILGLTFGGVAVVGSMVAAFMTAKKRARNHQGENIVGEEEEDYNDEVSLFSLDSFHGWMKKPVVVATEMIGEETAIELIR